MAEQSNSAKTRGDALAPPRATLLIRQLMVAKTPRKEAFFIFLPGLFKSRLTILDAASTVTLSAAKGLAIRHNEMLRCAQHDNRKDF